MNFLVQFKILSNLILTEAGKQLFSDMFEDVKNFLFGCTRFFRGPDNVPPPVGQISFFCDISFLFQSGQGSCSGALVKRKDISQKKLICPTGGGTLSRPRKKRVQPNRKFFTSSNISLNSCLPASVRMRLLNILN